MTWKNINQRFENADIAHKMYIVDSKASSELKQAMTDKNINYQLVPPHNHRANSAERAIQTLKEYFKTILATAYPKFPAGLWDFFTGLGCHNAESPRLSAYACIHRSFNINTTPLAPPTTRVVVQIKLTV